MECFYCEEEITEEDIKKSDAWEIDAGFGCLSCLEHQMEMYYESRIE